MQRFLIAVCAVVGLLVFANSAANAQFYISVHGGANFMPDSDVDGSGVSGEGSLDPGFAVGGILGYRIGVQESLAIDVEGEFAYRRNDVDKFSATGFADNTGGYTQSFAWMGNVWLNWLIGDSGFAPYIGGGAGAVHVDINDARIGTVNVRRESDLQFGWQVGGGLGYQLDEHFVLSLDYRFLVTDDINIQGFEVEYQSHSAMLGIKYLF